MRPVRKPREACRHFLRTFSSGDCACSSLWHSDAWWETVGQHLAGNQSNKRRDWLDPGPPPRLWFCWTGEAQSWKWDFHSHPKFTGEHNSITLIASAMKQSRLRPAEWRATCVLHCACSQLWLCWCALDLFFFFLCSLPVNRLSSCANKAHVEACGACTQSKYIHACSSPHLHAHTGGVPGMGRSMLCVVISPSPCCEE